MAIRLWDESPPDGDLRRLAELETRFDGPIPPELIAGGTDRHAYREARSALATAEDQLRKRLRAIRSFKAAAANGALEPLDDKRREAWLCQLYDDLGVARRNLESCRTHFFAVSRILGAAREAGDGDRAERP